MNINNKELDKMICAISNYYKGKHFAVAIDEEYLDYLFITIDKGNNHFHLRLPIKENEVSNYEVNKNYKLNEIEAIWVDKG